VSSILLHISVVNPSTYKLSSESYNYTASGGTHARLGDCRTGYMKREPSTDSKSEGRVSRTKLWSMFGCSVSQPSGAASASSAFDNLVPVRAYYRAWTWKVILLAALASFLNFGCFRLSIDSSKISSLNLESCKDDGAVPTCADLRAWQSEHPDMTLKEINALAKYDYTVSTLGISSAGKGLFFPNTALTFAEAGVKPEIAGRCVMAGYDYQQYLQWKAVDPTCRDARECGIDLSFDEALAWKKKGVNCDEAKMCVESRADLATYPGWKAEHFDCQQAVNWSKIGFTPHEAGEWRLLSVNPSVAAEFKSNGLEQAELREMKAKGVDLNDPKRTILISQLVKSGYSLKRALYYARNDVAPANVKAFDERVASQQTFDRLVAKSCGGKVHSQIEMLSNPYKTSGQCYDVLAYVVQWLGPARALMNIDFSATSFGIIAVDFQSSPNRRIIKMLAIGEGAFSYTSAEGALMTVPRIRVLTITNYGAF
jgi:hypothetical protein